MITTSDYLKILRRELEVRLTRNPRYSLRCFAKDLKTTAPFLSDVLKGRRGFSRASAFRITGKLGFDANETALFCDLVESHHARSIVAKNQAKERLRLREVASGKDPSFMKEL